MTEPEDERAAVAGGRLPASRTDRERVIELLKVAFIQDRLTQGELDTRVGLALASRTWTAQDPDVYRGPFNHRTGHPVLVIGAVWDPATAYSNAVKVAQMLPGSRLIASNNWGHTSLGTGACVDNDTFAYLINPTAPAPKITLCTGDVQPFASSSSAR